MFQQLQNPKILQILNQNIRIKADFTMEMYNADGTQGEMCGNAIRCVGKYQNPKILQILNQNIRITISAISIRFTRG